MPRALMATEGVVQALLEGLRVPTRDRRREARSHVCVWNGTAVPVSMPPDERGKTGRSAGVGD